MRVRKLLGLGVLVALLVVPGASAQDCGCMDVAILLDVTGSMGGALASVQAEIPIIVANALAASGGDLRLGAISIDGDFAQDFITVDSPLDFNVAAVEAIITGLTLGFGGGSPEASDEALNAAVNALAQRDVDIPGGAIDQTGDMNAFRPDCVDIAVVITDNEPGGFNDVYTVGVDDVNAALYATQAAANGYLISAIQVGADPVAIPIMQNYATTTGGVYVQLPSTGVGAGQALNDIIEDCGSACDPDPRTQGYWNRQCLGAGLILAGRNGRGPQFPNEPNFDKLLTPVSDALLNLTGGTDALACEDGIDAVPASDQCEKAKKQLTATLFNIESGRLQESCEVDLSAEGCTSTNVGDAIQEIADLINGGDCNTAKSCAAALNEGTALESADVVDYSFDPNDLPLSNEGLPPTQEEITTVLSRSSAAAEATTVEVEASGDVSAEMVIVTDVDLAVEEAVEVEAPEATPSDAEYTEELLTALSGGYEPEARLDMVLQLIDHVDQDLHSLLVAHLLDIVDEARAFGEDALAKKAERLIQKLEPASEE